MQEAVEGLVRELRDIGVPVATSEYLDALQSLGVVGVTDRSAVKVALGSALAKSVEHLSAFERVFDIYFAPVGAETATSSEPGAFEGLDDAELRDVLVSALLAGDPLSRRRIVSIMVSRHARFVPGVAAAGTLYTFRVFRALDLDALRAELIVRTASRDGDGVHALQRRLSIRLCDDLIEDLKRDVESDIRRRLIDDRGADAVSRSVRQMLPEDTDFLNAATVDLDRLRETAGPLARRLAVSIARRRRSSRRGPLDFRRTSRLALSTGGVPMQLAFHHSRPPRLQLMVLADISGSVASFANFTLRFIHAMGAEFAALRTFVFVDGVDEVTDLFRASTDIVEIARRINDEGRGVLFDGRSDYGQVFETFGQEWSADIGTRTTMLVLGDARNNYRASRADALRQLQRRAGSVIWLNPEPRAAWGAGDSAILDFAPYCDAVYECRSLRQLRTIVDTIA